MSYETNIWQAVQTAFCVIVLTASYPKAYRIY